MVLVASFELRDFGICHLESIIADHAHLMDFRCSMFHLCIGMFTVQCSLKWQLREAWDFLARLLSRSLTLGIIEILLFDSCLYRLNGSHCVMFPQQNRKPKD